MKVLYAIQGSGNGHLSRARDIIPALKKYCDTDIVVSGYQAEVCLPFKPDFKCRGLSFIFGKKGGVDFWNTYIEANIKEFKTEIKSLPVENYDLVINDFEPVSAWASYHKKVPCIALSHQAAVLHKVAPKPKNQDLLGKFILKNYAPSSMQFGFHYEPYASNIFTPIIRQEIRNLKVKDEGYYTVYLPAYSDKKLIKLLSKIKGVHWQVFSKHTQSSYEHERIKVFPINNENYIESLRNCRGVLCGAGFEGPAEAIHLGKKLMVVPMSWQYEQQCNAAALKEIGVPVIKKLKAGKLDKIKTWIDSDYKVDIQYPDNTDSIIKKVFEEHVSNVLMDKQWDTHYELKYDVSEKVKRELLKK
ncbi:MAG: glycosyl transferase [Bacteroidetes bacterium MedPE-SWsnd-G2]|nr:MAG: glycosyl transferase [Bacteroidetes bacterium MedPE-SWsnd-G2]